MMTNSFDLPRLFQAVTAELIHKREELNRSDPLNHDHGDHMVEVFQLATQAATEKHDSGLAEAMAYASELLRQRPQNGSAQVYARGLSQLAAQFRQRQIGLDDLLPYVRGVLRKRLAEDVPVEEPSGARAGDVLKALLGGLAGWESDETGQSEPGTPESSGGLDMGYLFGMGMSYLQAKQKGGDKLEILVETVVSASPLSRVPHRQQSGKLVLRTLLAAMGEQTP